VGFSSFVIKFTTLRKLTGITVTLLCAFSHLIINAQQIYHARFSGNTAAFSYTLYLQNVMGDLSANLYSYPAGTESYNKVTDRTELIGKLIDGTIQLRKPGEKSAFIEGKQHGDTINAILSPSEEIQVEINLTNTPISGGLSVTLAYIGGKQALNPADPFTPHATIELTAFVCDGCVTAVKQQLLRFAALDFPDDSVQETHTDSLLKLAVKKYFAQYSRLSESPDVARSAGNNWERVQQMQLLYNEQGVYCAEKLIYAYTGGAHGLTNTSYLLLNTHTGLPIELPDLITPDSIPALTTRITNKLKLQSGLEMTDSLSANGFFVDVVRPNENFYVCPDGLGFVYNSYEIAPYAKGLIRVSFNWNELSGLLNESFVIPGYTYRKQ